MDRRLRPGEATDWKHRKGTGFMKPWQPTIQQIQHTDSLSDYRVARRSAVRRREPSRLDRAETLLWDVCGAAAALDILALLVWLVTRMG